MFSIDLSGYENAKRPNEKILFPLSRAGEEFPRNGLFKNKTLTEAADGSFTESIVHDVLVESDVLTADCYSRVEGVFGGLYIKDSRLLGMRSIAALKIQVRDQIRYIYATLVENQEKKSRPWFEVLQGELRFGIKFICQQLDIDCQFEGNIWLACAKSIKEIKVKRQHNPDISIFQDSLWMQKLAWYKQWINLNQKKTLQLNSLSFSEKELIMSRYISHLCLSFSQNFYNIFHGHFINEGCSRPELIGKMVTLMKEKLFLLVLMQSSDIYRSGLHNKLEQFYILMISSMSSVGPTSGMVSPRAIQDASAGKIIESLMGECIYYVVHGAAPGSGCLQRFVDHANALFGSDSLGDVCQQLYLQANDLLNFHGMDYSICEEATNTSMLMFSGSASSILASADVSDAVKRSDLRQLIHQDLLAFVMMFDCQQHQDLAEQLLQFVPEPKIEYSTNPFRWCMPPSVVPEFFQDFPLQPAENALVGLN